MVKLIEHEMCGVTGIKKSVLDRWIMFGLIEPETAEDEHRYYSLSQCVAVATAARFRDAGASFERVAGILQFLSVLPFERLEAELEAGRTIPIPATMLGLDWLPGMMVAMPENMPREVRPLAKKLEMRSIHKLVMQKIDKLTRRQRKLVAK